MATIFRGSDNIDSNHLVPKQEAGDSITNTMSQKAITDAINLGSTGAYGLSWNQVTDSYLRKGATNVTQIQSQMKRCVLNTDGTVNYFLDPYDSSKKSDGTPSVLDGTDGNVMVQVPKFYFKYEINGDEHTWMISNTIKLGYTLHPAFNKGGVEVDYRYYRAYEGYNNGGTLISRSGITPTKSQTIGTFRTQAQANGTGWHLTDWNLLTAIQLLYLVEYGTFNSEAMTGAGNYTGEDYGIVTGQSNDIGNSSSGPLNNNTWMSYRGIENFYADIWEFIDGINVQNYGVFINDNHNTFASDVFTGDYVDVGVTVLAGASATYIKEIANSDKGFLPTLGGGSSTTYLTDGFYSSTGNRVVLFGGDANLGAVGGAFCLNVSNASSNSFVSLGGSVSF